MSPFLSCRGMTYHLTVIVSGFEINDKGMVIIRDYSKEDIRSVIEKSIQALKSKSTEELAVVCDS